MKRIGSRLLLVLIATAMIVVYMPAMVLAEAESDMSQNNDVGTDHIMTGDGMGIDLSIADERDVKEIEKSKSGDGIDSQETEDSTGCEEIAGTELKAQENETSGKCGENLTWTLSEDGVLTISGSGAMYDFYNYEDEEDPSIVRSPFAYEMDISSIVISEGVTYIGTSAFSMCLHSDKPYDIYLPTSLKGIGAHAFGYWSNEVTEVYYAGSASAWYEVVVKNNYRIMSANMHYYYGADKPNYLAVILDLDAGTIDGQRNRKIYEFDSLTQDFTLPIPVKSGYTFEGWYNDAEDAVSVVTAGTAGVINLEAKWSKDSGAAGKVLITENDPPVAIVNQAYDIQPFEFYDDGDTYEVRYYCTSDAYTYDNERKLERIKNKYGLTFASNGRINGTPTEIGEFYLTACVIWKNKAGNVTGYTEYQDIVFRIYDSIEKYDIPASVREINLSDVNADEWYHQEEEGRDNFGLPGYVFDVKAGEDSWTKLTVSGTCLYIENNNTSIHVIDSDGNEIREYEWDTFYIFGVNPGSTYYIYANNKNGSKDGYVYLSDSFLPSRTYSGNLGNWEFKATKTNVSNPFKDDDSKWDVYTIGDINSWKDWSVKGYSKYGWMTYCAGINVISDGEVYYDNPVFDTNFGTSISMYKTTELSYNEEEMALAENETHHKANYWASIADFSYATDRKYKFTVDIYVPAGTGLYLGEDDYLHTGEAPEHIHSLTHVQAATATCTEDGNIEYWRCSICGKYFSDDEGQNELSESEVFIPESQHNLTHVVARAATKTAEGNIEYWYCETCGKYYKDEACTQQTTQAETIINKLDDGGDNPPEECEHVWDNGIVATVATCASEGVRTYTCTICGATKTEPIAKMGHTYGTWITTTPATEMSTGIQTRTCTVCGNIETQTTAALTPTLKAVKIAKPKAAKKGVTVNWKKISKSNLKNIKKVEIQVASDPDFSSIVKTATASTKKTSKKVKGLKKGAKYYVRIRALNGSHASAWSSVKSFKAK